MAIRNRQAEHIFLFFETKYRRLKKQEYVFGRDKWPFTILNLQFKILNLKSLCLSSTC